MSVRRRLRWVVLALAVGLGAAVVGLVIRTVRQQPAALVRQGLEMLPGVSQRIRDFRRVKVQDGRTVWEVAAREGSLFEEEGTVVVHDAVVQWHLEDGRTVGLRGREGTLVLEGRELLSVQLRGDIHVQLAEYEVRTDLARWERATGRIEAPGRIVVRGGGLELEGEDLAVDLEAHRLTLARDVRVRLAPREVAGRLAAPRTPGAAAGE